MVSSFRWILLTLLVTSCRPGSSPEGNGTISVEWRGSSAGTFRASATARWCVADTLLEVLAVRNDTAVGFALVAQDSVRAASYPVNETRQWTPGRPQANVGLRRLTPLALLGYEGYGGAVLVTSGNSLAISGTLDARLRPHRGADTLRLVGRFTNIPIVPAAPPCGRANRPGHS